MNTERWKRIEDLLQAALQVQAERQEEYLRQNCGDDPELFAEVYSLLTSHRKAVGFLESPALHVAAQTVASDSIAPAPHSFAGKQISHYRVLGPLGSGGMGVVYRAEDVMLGRGVAMKFLPGELASDRVAFERMQREARSASALDHPNICSIYELGEHNGQPFIVMQLLEGQTLREWIENAAEKDVRVRIRQVVDFAIQIANGLEAAHQKAIIHRDIKPANIFITTRGDAKILDFGLAKLVEEASSPIAALPAKDDPAATAEFAPHLTRTGTTVGTAYYMSPEQVRGEKLDERTDLFSMGLVLYEMVAGRRAFAGETGPAVHDAILHHKPTPVRQLCPQAPAELVRIISNTLEKDRTRRYASAREIRNDLETLREQMRPAGFWSGRNMTVAAGVVLIALVAGVALLIEPPWHGTQPATVVSPVKARRSVAVLGFRNLSDKAGDEWISTALAEMVSTEVAAGQQVRIIPGEIVARTKQDLALTGTGGYGPDTLAKIRKALGSDVVVQGSYLLSPGNSLRIDLQVQEAAAGDTIGAVSENGSEAQIAELVSRAGASLREQLGFSSVPAADLDKTRAALPANPQAVRLYSEGLAKSHVSDALAARDLLQRAITIEPDHALSHSLLAENLYALGYDTQAQAEAKKAFDLSQSLPRDNQLLVEGRYHELSNDYPAAIEAYRTLWKFFPDNLDYGLKVAGAQTRASLAKDALVTIAQLRALPEPARNDPRIDLAEANASDVLGDYKRTQQVASTAAEKAKLQGSRLLFAQAKEREGWAWDRLSDSDKAAAAFLESRDLAKAGGNVRAELLAQNGLGTVLYDKGDLKGAGESYEDALRLARQVGAQKNISAFASNVGNVLLDQGKLAEARRYYQESLEIDRLIDDKRGLASDFGSLANVLEGAGDLAGATRMQEQSLQAFRDVGDRRGEASTLNNLGNVLAEQGELARAKKSFETAMRVQQQIGYRRGRGFSLYGMAEVLLDEDHLPEARAAMLEAIALRKDLKDESAIAESQVQLARIALAQGNAPEAEELARSATEEFDRQKAVDNGCLSNAVLSRAMLAEGRLKDARVAADHAQSLCQRGQNRGAKFQSAIVAAEVEFKSGSAADAARSLDTVHTDAVRSGYLAYELESRLVMGVIEINAGKKNSGRFRLESVQKDAQGKAFALVARKARTLLDGGAYEF